MVRYDPPHGRLVYPNKPVDLIQLRTMYWPFNTPKEIEFLPWQERENLCSLAKWYHLRNPRTRVRIMIEAVAVLVGWALPGILLKPLGCPPLVGVLWAVSAPFLLLALCAAIERRHFRRACAVELLIRGIRPSGCFECGYNLTGTVSDHCPECGAALATDGQPRHTHLKHQTDQVPRKVKWGLICAVIGVALCFVAIRLSDDYLVSRFRAIQHQRELEAEAEAPIGSPLSAARAWFSARGLKSYQGTWSEMLPGSGASGIALSATERLSPGGPLHRPTELMFWFHMDADDMVKSFDCMLFEFMPPSRWLPEPVDWRRPLRKVIPLIPLLAFGLWAFWCLRRDVRKSTL